MFIYDKEYIFFIVLLFDMSIQFCTNTYILGNQCKQKRVNVKRTHDKYIHAKISRENMLLAIFAIKYQTMQEVTPNMIS